MTLLGTLFALNFVRTIFLTLIGRAAPRGFFGSDIVGNCSFAALLNFLWLQLLADACQIS